MLTRTLSPIATVIAMIAMAAPYANASDNACTFMPENNLHLQDRLMADNGMTEATFNKLIDEVVAIYSPIIDTYKAKLEVERKWGDSTVNAYAQQTGSNWSISMFGGLARREEVTPDGFQMVICHELGHHVGGYPLKGTRWAATEGQSDYFATQACARQLWSKQTEINAKFRTSTPAFARAACDSQYKATAEQDLCYRSSMAGLSLANLLGALGGAKPPAFDAPDAKRVRVTDPNHPAAQCRLDTYFNGAPCGKAWDNLVIPGKNHPSGQSSPEAEQDAEKYSCGGLASSAPGVRPGCWYKSLTHI